MNLEDEFKKETNQEAYWDNQFVWNGDYISWLEEKVEVFKKQLEEIGFYDRPCNYFVGTLNTTSTTKCKNCGKELHEH